METRAQQESFDSLQEQDGEYLILAKVPDKFAHLVENFIRDNFNQ